MIAKIRSLPLERRFAVYTSALLAAVIGVLLAFAYYEIRLRTAALASERLGAAAERTAQLVTASVTNRGRAMSRLARAPAIIEAMSSGDTTAVREAALLLAQSAGRGGTLAALELRRMSGERVTGVGDHIATADELRAEGFLSTMETAVGDSAQVSRLRIDDGEPRYWMAAPVRDPSGRLLGVVAEERRFRVTDSSALARIVGFLSDGAVPTFRNDDGSLWVSLDGRRLEVPSSIDSAGGALTYERADGERVAGAARIPGAPWSVIVDRPAREALASVRQSFRSLVIAGILMGIVGVILSASLGRRLARGLTTVTRGAEAISRGQYERRVGVSGDDEVGRLGAAFDAMAARVETAVETQRFLHDATLLLSTGLAEGPGLRALVDLCVPRRADWCAIHLLSEQGEPERLEVAHRDLSKRALLRELLEGYPGLPGVGSEAVDEARFPSLPALVQLGEEDLDRASRDERHRELLHALAPRSLVFVPLTARGRALGSIAMATSGSTRSLTEEDLTVTEELARRTAIAVDNARLYRSSVGVRLDAEAANRAKSDFLATMSHEIRTPINAMIGYAELLELGVQGPLTDEQQRSIARIRVSGTHLTALVDDMLDLSKIEARQLEVARVPAAASDVVERSVALINPQAAGKGVTIIDSEAGAVGVRYYGDPRRVQQILSNLLSNAVKFTAPGGEIRVSYGVGPMPHAPDSAEGAAAYIAVSDTGVGIPPDDLDRIFHPFVQLDAGYTRPHGGSGLGLAISKTLAEMMGGSLTVESEMGRGSRFTLWLPLATQGRSRSAVDQRARR